MSGASVSELEEKSTGWIQSEGQREEKLTIQWTQSLGPVNNIKNLNTLVFGVLER